MNPCYHIHLVDRTSHSIQKRRHAAGRIILIRHFADILEFPPVIKHLILIIKKNGRHMGVYVQFLFLFNHGIETANRITGQVAHGTAFIKDKDHFHMGRFYFLCRFFFRRSSLPEKKRR